MPARLFLAAQVAMLVLALSTTLAAGDWLGGQYWGQIGGCASCGGSMYGGYLPPGAIWVGEIGWGGGPGCGGPGCGCDVHIGGGKGDGSPIFTSDEVPAPSPVAPRTIPSDEIVPEPPQAAHLLQDFSRRVSYIEPIAPVERDVPSAADRVRVVTHASQPERLMREPIRIVSPDGSAGRMYR